MIELTVVLLLAILLLAYYTLGRNFSRPTILYVSGFLVCSVVAYCWKEEWGLRKMSPITASIIILGAFIFYLVELWDFRKHKKQIDTRREDMSFKPINNFRLILFLLFQIVTFILMAKAQMAYAVSTDLGEAIGEINKEKKFENALIQYPFYVRFPYFISMTSRPLWCILFPYYLFKPRRYNSQKFFLFLNFMATMVGTLLSGGRTSILYIIISFLVFLYMGFQYKKGWRGGLFPRKVMAVIAVVSALFIVFFAELGYAIGRKESETSENASLLFAVYCGAEIKNLDDYIQHPFRQGNESGQFAQYTLCGMYDMIAIREGKNEGRLNQPDLRFNDYGDYPLGNVYTTYYNFILDFGFLGALICTGVMSLIASFFYRKSVISRFWQTGRLDLWIVYFGFYMPAACFLSFFANKFFEGFTISGTIKQLIVWWILIIFLQGRKRNIAMSKQKKASSFNYHNQVSPISNLKI
ncbi:MAG: oligosaccharide repeat unit polymerase [Bacteroidaceae bacterium]|nr:oligosaccharide repeat unit polymerase [Bacteroidaceae bacterium]